MSADTRPTVYLLHGLLATSYAHFGAQIRRWQETFRVVPIDLPGHGRSRHEAKRPFYESCQAQLLHYMAKNGPGHVVGASYLGGSIALRAALAAPAHFCSLVLTGYVPEAPHAVVKRWAESFFALAANNPDLAQHYDELHGSRWRHTLTVVVAEIQEHYPEAIAVRRDELAALTVPTLLVNGSRKSDERMAAAALPSISPMLDAALIPRAGHMPSHEQPLLFALHSEQFWASLAPVVATRPGETAVTGAPCPIPEEKNA